jgi:hypothetical protein
MDFPDLADAVVRNNVGVDDIVFACRASFDGKVAVLPGTNQRLPLTNQPGTGGPWHWFQVDQWENDASVKLTWLRASATPSFQAGAEGSAAVK